MTISKSLVLVGAAAALAGAAAPAVAAVAAVEDDQLVSAPLETLDTRMTRLQQSGTRVTRFGIMWNEVARTRPANPTDPNDPAYDWTRTDMLVRGLAARGINPIISVYSTPEWSAGRTVTGAEYTQYNPYAPSAGDYGAFMRAAAKRYSGRFTPLAAPSAGGPGATPTTTPSGPLPAVRLWEVWNEPNLKRFLRTSSGGVSIPLYLRLVREAYPAVKAANPRAIVIVGSTGPRGGGSSRDGIGARPWLAGIARSPLSVRFDAYSQHIYPSKPPVSRTRAFPSWNSLPEIFAQLDVRRAREIARARGSAKAKLMRAPKMQVFITEAGYTTGLGSVRTVKVTPAQQAKYLRQMFTLRDVRNARVPVVMWFNLQDNADWPGGLMTESFANKPAYAAFRALARKGGLPASLRR